MGSSASTASRKKLEGCNQSDGKTYIRSCKWLICISRIKDGWIQLDAETIGPQKSLIDQILEGTFNRIKNREEFNDDIINDLMHLADQGQLNNYEKIIEKLK